MERGEEGGNFSRIFSTFGHEETISIAYVNHDTTPFRRILLQTIEKLTFLYHLSNLIPLLPFLFPRNNRKLDIYISLVRIHKIYPLIDIDPRIRELTPFSLHQIYLYLYVYCVHRGRRENLGEVRLPNSVMQFLSKKLKR